MVQYYQCSAAADILATALPRSSQRRLGQHRGKRQKWLVHRCASITGSTCETASVTKQELRISGNNGVRLSLEIKNWKRVPDFDGNFVCILAVSSVKGKLYVETFILEWEGLIPV